MTDLHSHILPGVDDGSGSPEESVAMLRMEAEQGIRHVVATPHFYPHHDDPDSFFSRRSRGEEALRQALARNAGLPAVTVGAEVYYFRGMSDSEILPALTIGGGRCILIEMPPAPWPSPVYEELEQIRRRRQLTPIIAHIDRYIGPFRTFGIPEKLEALPVLVQANASFFLERGTARMAIKMLKQGRIHLLGSDCHHVSERSPNLGPALERIAGKLGQEELARIASFERRVFQYE